RMCRTVSNFAIHMGPRNSVMGGRLRPEQLDVVAVFARAKAETDAFDALVEKKMGEIRSVKAIDEEARAREEHAKVLAEFSLKQRETILRWSQAKREWDRWLVHEGIDPERARQILDEDTF